MNPARVRRLERWLSVLAIRLGVPLSAAQVGKFANQETTVEIKVSVREEDVFIIQSGYGEVNDMIMELLIMINACKTASAKRVVAVIPYFPYSKQSKKKAARSAIPAKLLAMMLKVAGVTQVVTLDLHATHIQGFFDFPIDNLSSKPFIVKYIRDRIPDSQTAVIVSKNAGGAKRVTSIADELRLDFAIVHQDAGHSHISQPADGEHGELVLVGDVKGRVAIIVDDLLDSAKSFASAATLLKKRGATKVYGLATHGLMSGDALDILNNSDVDELAVTNSVPVADKVALCPKLKVIDVTPLIAEAIRRIHNGESVSCLQQQVPL
ncbi:Prps1a protein [Capsaspora owczarzaki ATCC 30864]|uniref:ribose-phosphate diphosphokinase n=1 Tax=Capsaspora owczarzaki (strain ATCC 30864) TaxID=595528 RepID=A0A0D2WGG9_CAPO3|nr:Prps1a protein [Capsaspora owczarzaki ATCC 30864]KJE88505.1 Prps1a protein [Capsaspora owczarzaki ATCC 30864]|eukprot:XP_004365024.1 Prps1a protein [Capsaspora owczarzaki ATCC 30864]